MPEVTLKAYESQIDQMIEESRYIEGLAHVRHLLSQYPRYVGAYYLLGKAMLEADQPEFAVDLFRRALNADPEHLVSRIGLGLAHQKLDELDAAIWNLERAFELEPGNSAIAEELRHVYGARDGVIPDSVTLSRAGLARMYIRAERYDRAASELQKLVDENPDRPDLLTSLAEAYWRAGQIVQASEIGQRLLDRFPYNIKANLLMAKLWGGEDAEESKLYMRRAGDVDPEGVQASNYMGTESPMPAKEVLVDRLLYDPGSMDVDTESRWYHQLEMMSVGVGISEAPPDMSETEVRLVDITAGLESQIEIPDWLRDMGGGAGSEDVGTDLGWGLDFGEQETLSTEQVEDSLVADAFGAAAIEQADEELWTEGLDVTAPEDAVAGEQSWEELLTADQADDSPDWLSEMQSDGAIETLEELPDFTEVAADADADLVEDVLDAGGMAGEAASVVAEADFFEEEVDEASGLDWLYGGTHEDDASVTEEEVDDGGALDWLKGIESTEEETPIEPEAADDDGALDWLQATGAAEELTPAEPEAAGDDGALEWWQDAGAAEESTPAEPEAVGDDGALDWLRGVESTEEQALVTEEAFADEGLDWMQDMSETPVAEQAPAEADFAVDEVEAAVAETAEDASAIDWLTALPSAEDEAEVQIPEASDTLFATEEPVAETAEPSLDDGEGSLDWLSGFGPIDDDGVVGDDDVALEGAPDWLRQLRPETPEEVAEEPAGDMFGDFGADVDTEEAVQAEPEAEAEDDVPDWMQAYTKKHGQTGMLEMPDWMDEYAPSPVQAAAEPEIAEPEVPAVDVDMFGWHAFGADIVEVKPVSAPEAGAIVSEEAVIEPVAESLDWLQDVEETSDATVLEIPDTEAEQALDWLQDTSETSDATVLEAPIETEDDWLTGFGEELSTETADVVEEDEDAPEPVEQFPDWLQDFGKTGDTSPFAELVEKPEAEETAEGAVDWLKDFGGTAEPPASTEVVAEEPVGDSDAVLAELFGETAGEDDGMLSGDNALAWLEELAAGKEDELRAQADAEQEDRVAELLGHPKAKATPEVEETPAEIEAVAEPDVLEVQKTTEEPAAIDAEALESGDMMSGADALAWLTSLSAGKEDELRAQAEVEQEERLAELLGRPKAEAVQEPEVEETPVEVEAVAEPEVLEVQEIAEEPEPAAVDAEALESGDMMSGADALAWLTSLSAGKEDELRAQAEAEQEERLAELLGRSKTEEAPQPEVEEAQVEAVAEPEPEILEVQEIVDESEPEEAIDAEELESGDMMSGDDALAWLTSLSAGKEDELRAQAEAEQKDRLAELLGRPKAETAPEPEVEEAPAEVEAIVEPEPEFEQAPVEMVVKIEQDTGILKVQEIREEPEQVETVDAEALESGDMMSGADALAFLKGLSAGKEDELRARAKAEQEERLAELLGRSRVPEPEAEEAPVEAVEEPEPVIEETFEEEAPEEQAAQLETLLGAPVETYVEELAEDAAETIAAVEEDVVEDITETADIPEPDAEAVEDFVEDVLPDRVETLDLSDVVEEIVEEPLTFDASAEEPLVEEITGSEAEVQVVEAAPEPESVIEEPAPVKEEVAPPVEAQPAATSVDDLEAMRAHLKRKRSDHPTRLNFARALWDANDTGESINQYARLIKSGALMDEVLADLQKYAEGGKETVLVLRSLGDAYMKLGDLDQALHYFNRAQNIL